KIDSDLNNQNDQWELNLDIDDSDLRLAPVVRPCSSTRVESSTITQKPVRIISGPAGIIQAWWGRVCNVDTRIYEEGDIKNFLKNEKLDQVVAIVKSCLIHGVINLLNNYMTASSCRSVCRFDCGPFATATGSHFGSA
ncbi:hypothetical protein Tco_0390745, partial [Tanacetum coccineum]